MQKNSVGPYVIQYGDVWRLANGQHENMAHVCDGTEELAVAMLDDVMVKTGSAKSVESWVKQKCGDSDITIIRFPVSEETVSELNLCANNSTRAAHLIENLTKIGSENPPLAARPKYPR